MCGAALLAVLTAAPAPAEIQVDVNRRPVRFGSVGPTEIGGRVFIPLRAVVEALGADVRWDAPSQTVYGSRGAREFALPIGARTARVNGKTLSLDEPARLISGNTMVPLRFVAEALGAEVEWNAPDQRVAIELGDSGGGGRRRDDDREPDRRGQQVSGELVSVQANERPRTITLRVDGVRQTFGLVADATITRGAEGGRGRSVDLNQLRPGDQVRLRLDERGRSAEEVTATGAAGAPGGQTVRGEVVSVSGGRQPSIVVLVDGTRETYEVENDRVFLRPRRGAPAAPVSLDQLRAGDLVQLRLGRSARSVDRIDAVRVAPRAR